MRCVYFHLKFTCEQDGSEMGIPMAQLETKRYLDLKQICLWYWREPSELMAEFAAVTSDQKNAVTEHRIFSGTFC